MAFSSFFAGLSGLKAHADSLGVIGNNLANVNTVGFKGSRVTFQDILSQSLGAGVNGAGNPQQVGLGVSLAAVDNVFEQGSLQNTGVVTDVAVQGRGFFVLADPAGGLAFTRAGNFSFDKDGNLITSGGHFVQGYTQPDATGSIPASGPLGNIQIPVGLTAPPQATSFLEARINLNAEARVDDPATSIDEAETFSTSVTIFDSLGSRHELTYTFRPVDTDADGFLDEWSYTIEADGAEVTGGTPGTPFVLATGTVQFASDGSLVSPAGNVGINIPGWTNGAAAQTIDWRLYESGGGGLLTGYTADSSVSSTNQDGAAEGRLRTLTISQDGLISGVFTNGVTLELARFALATFNNPNGLLKAGRNAFFETNTSGPATIGGANAGGRGTITPGSLELSNVDITQEFTQMIVTQRGYQANSRIITTTDEVIQEALNLKR